MPYMMEHLVYSSLRAWQAALGLGAVASYGLVSNVTYGGGMAVRIRLLRCATLLRF